ncbi:TLDc domain-containing protein [Entamoeba marina]
MEKVINSNEFINFKKYLNEVMKKINEVKEDIKEDINKKYNLEKYEQIIEGSDEDVLTQYETWYDQLEEVVINNTNVIKQKNELVQQLEELNKFIEKEKENNDEIKVTLNSLVYKMIEKKTIIFNKKEEIGKVKKEEKQNEYNKENERLEKEKEELLKKFNMEKEQLQKKSDKRKQEFKEKLTELDNMKYSCDSNCYRKLSQISNDENINFASSIDKLKKWSGKQHYNIIFDSKMDDQQALEYKVFNKRNLYFISFDNENNVFGGYVNELINEKDDEITDPNAFVFSLIRNGTIKNMKYNIKKGVEKNAFYLFSNNGCGPTNNYLFKFGSISSGTIVKSGYYRGKYCNCLDDDGHDISIKCIGRNNSFSCNPVSYEYNGEQQPLRNNSKNYIIKRVLILEMD